MAPTPPPTLPLTDLESWLSRPRLATYLAHTAGNTTRAVQLYSWNSQLAAAALADTCHLEVALRNAYDREISKTYPDWAVDSGSQLFRRTQGNATAVADQTKMNTGSRRELTTAARGLGASPRHGQVVAATSFGFWTKLTERERTSTFWTPMLHRAFAGSATRGQVHERIDRIRKFRNRLAHNEPAFSSTSGLHNRMRDVDEVFDWVAPAAAAHVRATSAVPQLLAECPVPGLL